MKNRELNKNIREKKQEIIKIITQHGGSNIRIFGSYSRGEETRDSDLDLLIDIEKGKSLLNRIAIKQELEDLLGIKVDIAKPENIHECIRNKVLKEAIFL